MPSFAELPWELKTSVIDKLAANHSIKLLSVSKPLRERVLRKGPFAKHINKLSFVFAPKFEGNPPGHWGIRGIGATFNYTENQLWIGMQHERSPFVLEGDVLWKMLKLIRSIQTVNLEIGEYKTKDGEMGKADQKQIWRIAYWLSTYQGLRSLTLRAHFPATKVFFEAFMGPKPEHTRLGFCGCDYLCDFHEDYSYLIRLEELSAIIHRPEVSESKMISMECEKLSKVWKALSSGWQEMVYLYEKQEADSFRFANLLHLLDVGIPSQEPAASMLYRLDLRKNLIDNPILLGLLPDIFNGKKRLSLFGLEDLGGRIIKKYGAYFSEDPLIGKEMTEVFYGGRSITFREVFETTLPNRKTYNCSISILEHLNGFRLYLFMSQAPLKVKSVHKPGFP